MFMRFAFTKCDISSISFCSEFIIRDECLHVEYYFCEFDIMNSNLDKELRIDNKRVNF